MKAFLLILFFCVGLLAGGLAQEFARGQIKKYAPCRTNVKTFIVEPVQLQDKINELAQQGYCLGANHMKIVGDKVLLVLDERDQAEDCEKCPECCGPELP